MSEIKVTSTESHYKTHTLQFLTDAVEALFREKCVQLLELDPKGFGLNGKLSFELKLSQMTEGSPPYNVNKWQANVKIIERIDG
jgi:hypothetical protein